VVFLLAHLEIAHPEARPESRPEVRPLVRPAICLEAHPEARLEACPESDYDMIYADIARDCAEKTGIQGGV
jgi:hypothetical protein